jgi:tetratricopeptide (TPR) repeat protein
MAGWARAGCLLAACLVTVVGLGGAARAGFDADVSAAAGALRAWDVPGAARVVASLEQAQPGHPDTLLVGGHLRLMQGDYAGAVEKLERAVAEAADDPQRRMASHYLALAVNTERETRDYVRHTTAAGHFVISHAPGVDAVLVPYAEEALESAWRELTVVFDHTPPAPVRVEIYPQVEVLGAVSPLTVEEIKTSGTIALCKYDRLMIVSPRDLVYGYTWRETLAHEFIHLLITQKSRNTVPIWLHEGLAKYYEGKWLAGGEPAMSRTSEDLLARALKADKLIPFEEMSPSMAKLPSQEATATAFAEVYTVIEFLEQRGGARVASQLLTAMRDGRDDREAVAEASRLPWARFEPAWRAHLRGRGLRTLKSRAVETPLLFKGDNTEQAELDALEQDKARRYTWLGDRLRLKQRWLAASMEYRKAAKVAGEPTPIVQSKLGYALLQLGRIDEAIAALDASLPIHDNYVLLHLYLGEAYLRKADLEGARRHLEEAVGLNPFDPDLHGRLATVYERLNMPKLAARERSHHKLVNAP